MAVRRPSEPLSSDTIAAFDDLLRAVAGDGTTTAIDYTLDAPKWQFLCYAAEAGGYVLHGSGNSDIDEFEPRQPHDTTEFGNQLAVYAASDGLWAMYFAIVNRDTHVRSLSNACYRIGPSIDGPFSEPYYFFSINEDAHDHGPWRQGTVYLLSADTFVQQPSIAIDDQWVMSHQVACRSPVRPVAKLSVGPDDFPLLSDIRGHDEQWRVTR
jgi:hypothetical protein